MDASRVVSFSLSIVMIITSYVGSPSGVYIFTGGSAYPACSARRESRGELQRCCFPDPLHVERLNVTTSASCAALTHDYFSALPPCGLPPTLAEAEFRHASKASGQTQANHYDRSDT
jgi:hypothetical protein